MSEILRRMMEDEQRQQKLANPLGNLDQVLNPTGGAAAQLAAASATRGLFEKTGIHEKLLADIYGTTSFDRLFDDLENHRRMLDGPLAEAKRIGLFDAGSDIHKAIAAATEAQSRYHKMFRLPELSELTKLAEQAGEAFKIANALTADFERANAVRSAMERMTQPWLNIEHARPSATAFANLVDLGDGITRMPPFDSKLVDHLRPSLGDWRHPISLDVEAIINPMARSELYAAQGVDPALTGFTVPAFHEGTVIVGLETPEDASDTKTSTDDADDEIEFVRAEKAFAQLRRFEVTVRKFIVEVMEDTFGEHWMRRQLPKDMCDKWADKRQVEIDAGRQGRSLIEYADFSDYKMIIEQGDNWKGAFKSVFRRPEDVRESFQRLYPVRIVTMHSRIVTLEDELLLMVETSRVLKAIRTRSR